mgnify:CR=1 FL=1
MKSKKMFLSLVAIIFSIFIGYNIYSVEVNRHLMFLF